MDEKLTAILRDILKAPDLVISDDLTARDVETWDSFSHIQLILAVEEGFGVQFAVDEIGTIANVGELKALISAKTGQPG